MASRGRQAQGWFRDPSGRHQDRYYSDGTPTKLVRDGSVESYDEPIGTTGTRELVPAAVTEPSCRGAEDLRRADDARRGCPADASRRALDAMARCRGAD